MSVEEMRFQLMTQLVYQQGLSIRQATQRAARIMRFIETGNPEKDEDEVND